MTYDPNLPFDADEGWAWPIQARKPHYFREGRALCRRWLWLGGPDTLDPDTGPGPDDCVGCRKVLDR